VEFSSARINRRRVRTARCTKKPLNLRVETRYRRRRSRRRLSERRARNLPTISRRATVSKERGFRRARELAALPRCEKDARCPTASRSQLRMLAKRSTRAPRQTSTPISALFVSGKSLQKGIARRDGRKSIIARGVTRLGLLWPPPLPSRENRASIFARRIPGQTNGIRYSGGNIILLPREARLLVRLKQANERGANRR